MGEGGFTMRRMQIDITGQGDPLVLVGGGLTGWLSWVPHAERLAAERRIVRAQLLSVEFGLSGKPLPADYSVRMEAEALRGALDAEGIGTADIAGWSFGGFTSLTYALDHPDAVRSLTLIEPPAFWVLRTRGPLPDDVLAEQKVFQSFGPGAITEEQLEQFAHIAGIVPPGADPHDLPSWPVWVEHRQSLRIGDAPYRMQGDIARVRRFDKPVLLLNGEGSPPYYHAIIDILAEEFPDARIATLPGGHAPHIVSMEPFMRMLRDFLADAAQ
jgi:pimeloyl-ACP methyl ester carboxylesterase